VSGRTGDRSGCTSRLKATSPEGSYLQNTPEAARGFQPRPRPAKLPRLAELSTALRPLLLAVVERRSDRPSPAYLTLDAGVMHLRNLNLTPCMPCSFGLLPHPTSGACALPNGLPRVTVIVRWIPLVTAAYGTRVARPARTTRLAPGGDGSRARHEGEAVLGDHRLVGKPRRRRGSRVSLWL
jgi:hypothetical protein